MVVVVLCIQPWPTDEHISCLLVVLELTWPGENDTFINRFLPIGGPRADSVCLQWPTDDKVSCIPMLFELALST